MKLKCLTFAGALMLATTASALAAVPIDITATSQANKNGVNDGHDTSGPYSLATGFYNIVLTVGNLSSNGVTGWMQAAITGVVNGSPVSLAPLRGDYITSGSAVTVAFNNLFLNAGSYTVNWSGEADAGKGKDANGVVEASLNFKQVQSVPGPEAGAGIGALALGGAALWMKRRRKDSALAA